MSTRRILYLDHTAVLSGGEVAMHNLIAALDRHKWHPVAILGRHGPLVERLVDDGIGVRVLPMPPVLTDIRQGFVDPLAIWNPMRSAAAIAYARGLGKYMRREQIELVHANSLRACVLGGLAARWVGVPVIWQIHAVVGSSLMSRSGLRLMQVLAKILPTHIICNSRTSAADFGGPGPGITVIPCGVDSSRFMPNGRNGQKPVRIGMIARFAPLKGQHLLVEAARTIATRHPDTEFIFAGTPLFGEEVYAQEVQEHAQRSLRGKVRFYGFVDDVPSLLHDLDIVVNPSTIPEGFGQAIVEAMMAGKPVIASALGGPVDVIKDGVTGRLIPAGDPSALADAIGEMVSDPVGAAEMGRRGRERAVELYDLRRTTRAIEEVYEKVLAGR